MKIPYIVIRYAEIFTITDEVVRYRYQIFIENDDKLKRLGFKPEREILRFRDRYMYRNLSDREIKLFRLQGHEPQYSEEGATIWEFNGKVKRYKHPRSLANQ